MKNPVKKLAKPFILIVFKTVVLVSEVIITIKHKCKRIVSTIKEQL